MTITRYSVIVAALILAGMACASSQGQQIDVTVDPYRATPLEGAIVIELDVSNYTEVCVRASPAIVNRYHCITVGSLRTSLEQYRNAKGRSWPVGKIRALLGF